MGKLLNAIFLSFEKEMPLHLGISRILKSAVLRGFLSIGLS